MVAIADIVESVKSGVVHIVHTINGERAGSGTGFMVDGYLVTNYHVVFQASQNSVIVLRTFDSSNQIFLDGIQLTYNNFIGRIKTSSKESGYDYCVLDIPELTEKKLHNFTLGETTKKRIGDNILFLGYPLDHLNLVCHTGIISSFYKSGVTNVIQIDASVNQSNSGGPLIDPETCQVIGIITRKATGLTQVFSSLRSILEHNIKFLSEQQEARFFLNNFEPIQGIRASQEQILKLTFEIERSANVGIGYAFSIEHLKDENIFYQEQL